MKRNIFTTVVSLTAMLGGVLPAVAQTTTPSNLQATIERAGITRSGDAAGFDMTLNWENLKLKKNQRLILRPVICSGTDTLQFTPIVLNGRTAAITYERNDEERIDGAVVYNTKQRPATAQYRARVPYKKWMDNSRIYLLEDHCGCGVTWPGDRDGLTPAAAIQPQKLGDMQIAFATPQAEAVKQRAESGSAYINFPVNQTVIRPEYHENEAELNKILNTIQVVKDDSHITIERITIHGYASPEGTFPSNAKLAEGRAETLTQYVAKLSNVDKKQFVTESTPEDWAGLTRYLQNSQLAEADDILKIIDSEADPDRRELLIRQRYPDVYKQLLADVYPRLRHSDYTVQYTVRPFTLDEARAYLQTHPSYLSLDEFNMVANSYAGQPSQQAEVWLQAAATFPEDATAQLNAACACLKSNHVEEAEFYLSRAGNSPQALNAQGIVAIKKGDLDSARQLLSKSAQQGCTEAKSNLSLLETYLHTQQQQQLDD
jgi:outer membrane protein OmpA-like peptidoglycan-associated protein